MTYGKMKFASRSVVTAQPGFELITLFENECGLVVACPPEPILAWRIEVSVNQRDEVDVYESTWPVCIESLYNNQRWLIRYPDGQVNEPEGGLYRSLKEALEKINSKIRPKQRPLTQGE